MLGGVDWTQDIPRSPVKRQEADYVRVMLALNVDDILQEIRAQSVEEVIEIAKPAARHLLFRIKTLGLAMATNKSAMTAS